MASNVIHVYHEPLETVSSVIKQQLYRLNNRWNGRMLEKLKIFYRDLKWDDVEHHHVYYIKGKGNIIKAWAMVRKELDYITKKPHYIVDFYTKKSERGKGYGSALAETVRKDYKGLYGAVTCSTIFKRHNIR